MSVIHESSFDLFSWCCSLYQTIVASKTSCHGLDQMAFTFQRKKLLSATSSRLSGTLHPFEREKHVFLTSCFKLSLGLQICFFPDTSVILLFCVLRSCNRSLEVEDTDEGSISPSSSCPPPTSRNNSFKDRCRNQSVIIFPLLLFNHVSTPAFCVTSDVKEH